MEASHDIFDRNAYTEYFGGDAVPHSATIYKNCALQVIGSLDKRLSLLSEAIEHNEREEVLKAAHLLKGGLRMIGSPHLAQLCQQIEHGAKELDSISLQSLYSELQANRKDFLERLNDFLKELSFS